MKESLIVDINGRIVSGEEASVSVSDAGFYFGFGIYETFLLRDKVPIFYEEHIVRLKKGLTYFGFPNFDELVSELPIRIKSLVVQASADVSEGAGAGGGDAGADYKLRIVVTPGELDAKFEFNSLTSILYLFPINKKVENIVLMLASLTKNLYLPLPPFVKITSNNKNLASIREAKGKGADEALLINEKGFITECSFSNFFFVKENIVYTASEENNILSGITRKVILIVCERLNLTIKMGDYRLEDLRDADEAFISSSTRGIVPVSKILCNEKPEIKFTAVNKDSVIYKMQLTYFEIVKFYIRENHVWL